MIVTAAKRPAMLVVLCFPFLAGCGGAAGIERAAISGTVQLDGTPIERGTIVFLPSDGKGGPSTGGEIEHGKYAIPAEKGASLGEHKVEIRSLKKTGKQIPVLPPAVSETGLTDEMEEAVPAQFNSQSILTEKIQSGQNTFNFDLKSP